LPKQETSVAKNAPFKLRNAGGAVEVHQDPEAKDQIIIQYLEQAKDVVRQVPSNQKRSAEHGIAQEFHPAAKLRASANKGARRKRRRKISWGLALTPRVC
jgi:hypothetical protein